MRTSIILLISGFFVSNHSPLLGQHPKNDWSLQFFAGTINYQGDLKPTSFTFNHSNPAINILVRKPINNWLSFRMGMGLGKIEGADRYNRNYLVPRNLSFYSTIKEISAELEVAIPEIAATHLSAYLYGGMTVFHFNPWTYDRNGKKTHLHPLSTEGQGLPGYPERKPYKLIQPALSFGTGFRYELNECIQLGITFSQRKSFTDYLDDVSSFYPDKDDLLAAKGITAVQLAYRGDELPGGAPYPPHAGTQRGTASEMDWYYYFGLTIEFKLNCIKAFLSGWKGSHESFYASHCPK